jgi:hypothetical protein
MQATQQLNEHKIACSASLRERLVAASVFLILVALFGVFWLVAHDKIAKGWWFEPCGFKQRYGLPCPTCGMTTSVLAFMQGKIFEAFYVQPAAALLCSALVATAFLAFLVAVFGLYFGFLKRFLSELKVKYVIVSLIIIFAAGWAVTLARELGSV